jgi:hypothetical protein
VPITQADQRKLFQLSGNRCAFPGCPRSLVHPQTVLDDSVVLSEVAHIVARSLVGPRGHHPVSLSERDGFANLILLCEEHHHIVDAQPHFYTVARLLQFKRDHEDRIGTALDRSLGQPTIPVAQVRETLHSTLLPVERMPPYVYDMPVTYREGDEKQVAALIGRVPDPRLMTPFLLREGRLYCFNNLRNNDGPFRALVSDPGKAHRAESATWWSDEKLTPWFTSLLNRSLNKLTGWRGLNLDKDHNRYYFQPPEPGKPLSVDYTPLNQAKSTRQAVWQPVSKRTNTPRPYWNHLAVGLNFQRVGRDNWCLVIRPEMRITRDGVTPIESAKIGGKVTRRKSRMFNYDLLEELQFWRDYLSDSSPRIVFPFEPGQHIVVSNRLMESEIDWPGIPEEYAKPFRNIEPEEDLFTAANREQLEEEYLDNEDEWDDAETEE